MTMQDQASSSVNDTGTNGKIDTPLTQPQSGFVLENTRRNLIALRVKHGANSPIGHRCSTAVEQLQNGYLAGLQRSVAELARLTSQ